VFDRKVLALSEPWGQAKAQELSARSSGSRLRLSLPVAPRRRCCLHSGRSIRSTIGAT